MRGNWSKMMSKLPHAVTSVLEAEPDRDASISWMIQYRESGTRSDRKYRSASDKYGHQGEGITRRVGRGVALRYA